MAKQASGNKDGKGPEVTQLGGTETSGNGVETHYQRVARFGDCKRRSKDMGHFIQGRAHKGQNLNGLASEILSCANYLVFHNYYTVEQIRLAKISTCKKHMLCPVCARIRAAKQIQRYLERLEILRAANPGIRLALLTLTVQNGDDLDERYKHLKDSWQKYQKLRRNYAKRGTGFNELCKVTGAVFSYEITNKGAGWHPHLHAVVILDRYIEQDKLSQEWLGITGDSYIVDIRKIKGDPLEGFLEVFKYALKFSELSLELNLQAYLTLRGKRMQGSFGDFHGIEMPETGPDELLEGLPYLQMYYAYISGIGYDLKTITPVDI